MTLDILALGLALAGPLVLLGALRARRVTSVSWSVRTAFWLLAAAALALIVIGNGLAKALMLVGLLAPTPASLPWALAAIASLMLTAGIVAVAQRALGSSIGDQATFNQIAEQPAPLRVFIVLTAGVVEELLYRGIGIGLGSMVMQSTIAAAALSVAAFVIAHFKWRAAHLVQVAAAGLILSLTFLLTGGDLWACIIAHLVVDALGFLLVPLLLAARRSAERRRQDIG